MSDFMINVEMDGRTNGGMKKGMPMSQSHEVRKMFHARFDCYLVL